MTQSWTSKDILIQRPKTGMYQKSQFGSRMKWIGTSRLEVVTVHQVAFVVVQVLPVVVKVLVIPMDPGHGLKVLAANHEVVTLPTPADERSQLTRLDQSSRLQVDQSLNWLQ